MLAALIWLVLFLIAKYISGKLILFYKLRNIPHRKTGLLGLLLGDIVYYEKKPSDKNIDGRLCLVLMFSKLFISPNSPDEDDF